jgi:hypothetical protein
MNLILGHNQFIGISHTSEEKSIELQKKFYEPSNIYKVVEIAANLGYKNMIIETHPKMLEFLEYYLRFRTFDMNFYLQVPNIQGYIQKMNEKGISGLFTDLVQRDGIRNFSNMALRNVVNFAKRDYFSIAASALQFEVAPFLEVNIKALLLHNVSTDLLLSLQLSNAFAEYINYVRDNLQLHMGFITLNFPLFVRSFDKWKLGDPLVITPINPKGFDMNPSKKEVESSLKAYPGEIAAMNVLGGGAFSVHESNNYLKEFKNIKSCVVGASSHEHLNELMEVFGNSRMIGIASREHLKGLVETYGN